MNIVKGWKGNKNEKIIKYLNEQLSKNIKVISDLSNDDDTYEKIILELRKYYESNDYKSVEDKKQSLKLKIIVLESKKISIKDINIVKDISILFTIMLSFITIFTNIVKDILKNDIGKSLVILQYIVFVFVFIIVLISVINHIDLNIGIKNRNENIAIDIHKSVIEEILEDIEKSKKKQEDETNITLKEIEKIVEGTQREVSTLLRVFGGVNNINK